MRIPVIFRSAGLLLLFASAAHALQPLEHFVDAARKSSFDAREATATERQHAEETTRAWSALIPTLTTRAAYTRNQYPASSLVPANPSTGAAARSITIIPEDQFDAFLVLDVPLVDLSKWGLVSAAKHAEAATVKRGVQTGLELDKQVARAYFSVIGGEALLQATDKSLRVALQNHELVVNRQSAGLATDLDVRRASAEVERAKQQAADAKYILVVTRRNLETLTTVTPAEGAPSLSDDLHAEAPVHAFEEKTTSLPSVLAAESDEKGAHANVNAAWGALAPSLAANFTERFTNATGFAGQSQVYAAGVTATWRLDAGAWAGVKSLEAAETAASVRRERAMRAAKDQVFQAWAQVESLTAKARASRSQVDATDEAARLAHERYTQGRATQLEVVQADRDAFDATVSRIQADADLAYARVWLRSASGETLAATSTKETNR